MGEIDKETAEETEDESEEEEEETAEDGTGFLEPGASRPRVMPVQ